MAAELIGRCRCPVCSSDKARLSLAKSRLVVITCNGCNFQGFARSDRSDEKLRALLIAEPKEPQQEPQAATPAPAPAAPPAPAPKPNTTPSTQADAKPAAWGAFPWIK